MTGRLAAFLLIVVILLFWAAPADSQDKSPDLGAWAKTLGLNPVGGPVALHVGMAFKSKVNDPKVFRKKSGLKASAKGNMVIITLVGRFKGGVIMFELTNLSTGHSTIMKLGR